MKVGRQLQITVKCYVENVIEENQGSKKGRIKMNYNLWKLEKITNLLEVWKNVSTDFTKWLAKENNIKLLSEELGFNITVDETEGIKWKI